MIDPWDTGVRNPAVIRLSRTGTEAKAGCAQTRCDSRCTCHFLDIHVVSYLLDVAASEDPQPLNGYPLTAKP